MHQVRAVSRQLHLKHQYHCVVKGPNHHYGNHPLLKNLKEDKRQMGMEPGWAGTTARVGKRHCHGKVLGAPEKEEDAMPCTQW